MVRLSLFKGLNMQCYIVYFNSCNRRMQNCTSSKRMMSCLCYGLMPPRLAECGYQFVHCPDCNAVSSHGVPLLQLFFYLVCRYAIVTRPVRQGRLKLALEEVLTTQPDPPDPATLQSPHDHAPSAIAATTAALPATAQSLNNGSTTQSAPSQAGHANSDGNLNQPGLSPAALRASQDAPLQLPSMLSRRDSQMSSGRLSNVSSASGNLLPSPLDLTHKNSSVSSPSSHGTEYEFALQSRRHSLHRAPKVR